MFFYNVSVGGGVVGFSVIENCFKNLKEKLLKSKQTREKFKGKKIPRPPHWSGYKVKPSLIEFWQEMPFRLHDRVEFIISKKEWTGRRLYP